MNFFRKVIEDAVPYSSIEWIDQFEALFDKADLDYDDFDFSDIDLDTPSSTWASLMYSYIQGILEANDFKFIDIDYINIDYYEGVSYSVDFEDEELINEINKFNELQDIQIEIIED